MCGISGIIDIKNIYKHNNALCIKNMCKKLYHRGPNSFGTWEDNKLGVYLGHTRLSIIDTTMNGSQPMASSSGRYILVFNGEIYNHKELKNDISFIHNNNYEWKGQSDSEILVASIETWGVRETLNKLTGMFAFAIFDRKECKLTLVRDRFGEKPLYYGFQNNIFLFASELKAIKTHPAFENSLNINSIGQVLSNSCVIAPDTIYKGILKLNPASYLTLSINHGEKIDIDKPVSYWDIINTIINGKNNPFRGDDDEAIFCVNELLKNSISKQMISDVPIGAFLSGGIDSSLVVSIMQSLSKNKVKTFTIGFNEDGYNEAKHAKKIANYLDTDHTELYVSASEALSVIPKIPKIYDEPFSDSSQIPTFLVSQLAAKDVSVSLSGDGGDELFGGYNRYIYTKNWWSIIQKFPFFFRKRTANLLNSISPSLWNSIGNNVNRIFKNNIIGNSFENKIEKISGALKINSTINLYKYFISNWKNPNNALINSSRMNTFFMPNDLNLNIVEQMMYLDTINYLPNDILVKLDRASMAVSLESRVPMLDHKLAEFSWTLPLDKKIRNNQGKWILKKTLSQYLPNELIDRPKMGFGVPIDYWLRNSLNEWAENLLDESKLRKEGYFNPKAIRKKWDEHIEGKRNWQHQLWAVLMFQAWLDENHA